MNRSKVGQRATCGRGGILLLFSCLATVASGHCQELDKQQLLEAQTFWDNRDWPWYLRNIPFLDTPDPDINATYYYRWELVTKHLTYGSPRTGYSFTEFIDRPFWSGAYGAISCPAGHQLYEVRWLRDARYVEDYARYWFRTPGAQPRRYSTWLADSVWAVYLARGDREFALDLLDDLVRHFAEWEKRHYVPEVGLFWQTGHDDGMEFNINSRQTQDILRGAPSYRPSFNAYMYGDAVAISKLARLAGREEIARTFEEKARRIQELVQEKLWDPERSFFFPMFKNDEEKDGHVNRALSLTYQTGKYAGSPHGRELIGYTPWQFHLPEQGRGFEQAWRFLMDPDYFAAPFGPTVTERRDPLFLVTDRCCWWSGQSWPYATTQTLVALANLLNDYDQSVVSKEDYFRLLRTYALTHRKEGRPYLAEAANPDTGSWEGYDNYNHSEHYFHSGFCDLVLTGLVGLRPQSEDRVVVNPLAPAEWPYFALVDIPYHGRRLSVLWDRTGSRYGRGPGLRVLVDGELAASREHLGRLEAALDSPLRQPTRPDRDSYNFAVNNDGTFYPRLTASFTSEQTSLMQAQDGNYWYHVSPPNRWTTEGSESIEEWLAVDFGTPRNIHEVVLYFLDDGPTMRPPSQVRLEQFQDGAWRPVPEVVAELAVPTGRRSNRYRFPRLRTAQLRALMTPAAGASLGLSEFEAWGEPGEDSLDPPSRPPSLAANPTGDGFPRATASHTSRFDRTEHANDGVVSYRPSPHNRWTAYESPTPTDWLEIDFGRPTAFSRVELHLYDDRGGVQAPANYAIQHLSGERWVDVANLRKSPAAPRGHMMNTATFDRVESTKVRVVFRHRGESRSGLTEIEVWEQ